MKNYYSIDAISQSLIKKFAKTGPQNFLTKKDDDDSSSLIQGKALDILLFTPDEFEEQFIIRDVVTPPEQIKTVIDNFYALMKRKLDNAEFEVDTSLEANQQNVLDCASGLFNNIKDSEKRFTKIIKEGQSYYESLLACDGKYVLTPIEYNILSNRIEVLKSDAKTSFLFNPPDYLEVKFQFPIVQPYVGAYGGCNIKGLLDVVVINHQTKRIRVYDLKYTDIPLDWFVIVAKRLRYDIQMSFYTHLVYLWNKTNYNYDLEFPINIAINATSPTPYLYGYNSAMIERARVGDERYWGWKPKLDELIWHYQNGFNESLNQKKQGYDMLTW